MFLRLVRSELIDLSVLSTDLFDWRKVIFSWPRYIYTTGLLPLRLVTQLKFNFFLLIVWTFLSLLNSFDQWHHRIQWDGILLPWLPISFRGSPPPSFVTILSHIIDTHAAHLTYGCGRPLKRSRVFLWRFNFYSWSHAVHIKMRTIDGLLGRIEALQFNSSFTSTW